MSIHQPLELLQQNARIVQAPVRRNRHERTFDLHPAVHFMVIGSWLGFVAILCAAFMTPKLAIPAAIFFIGVVSLFLTPGLWARVKGDDGLPRGTWADFRREGVDCATGHLTSGEALAQIMTLPVLLVGVAIIMAVIKMTL